MQPIRAQDAAIYQRTKLIAQRNGSGLPSGLRFQKKLGKGSNNTVYLVKDRHGEEYVVRQPRRNSDTQRIGNASWEFRNTVIAADLNAAPDVYDAWYVRHSTAQQRSGLHFICAYYPFDVHALLVESPNKVLPISKQLRTHVTRHLWNMAESNLFCYDLKPSNMVFRESPIDVRFIDFGRDFCEWRPYSAENEPLERAPMLSFIQTLAEENCDERMSAKQLYTHLVYITMVIILSSNIAFTLEQDRAAMRCTFAKLSILNFMGFAAAELRQQTRGKYVKLVKQILRKRDIRDTIRHYMGRRNCGTKRCFAYAGFTN